jgi:hypothetical protein
MGKIDTYQARCPSANADVVLLRRLKSCSGDRRCVSNVRFQAGLLRHYINCCDAQGLNPGDLFSPSGCGARLTQRGGFAGGALGDPLLTSTPGFPPVEGNTRVDADGALFWTDAARVKIAQLVANSYAVPGYGGTMLSLDPNGTPFAQYVDAALGRGEHVLLGPVNPPDVVSPGTSQAPRSPWVRATSVKVGGWFDITLASATNSGPPMPVYAEPGWFSTQSSFVQLLLISLGIGGAGYALYRWSR